MAASRNAPFALTIGLIVLGLVLAVVGVLYFVDTAAHLPSFFPGHQAGDTKHYVKHGLLAIVLALLCWVGAWLSSGARQLPTTAA
jgi:hypothetical protein